MATPLAGALVSAVENMVLVCGGAERHARVLIAREPPGLGYYGDALAGAVAAAVRAVGLEVSETEVAFSPEAEALPADLADRMAQADLTIFLARIGDQLRFQDLPQDTRAIVCYALDVTSLASAFGTASHRGFCEIKDLVERALAGAEIEIRCPAGTEVKGRSPSRDDGPGDVTIRRFPMLVPAPVMAEGFSGRVALSGFLAGTGSRYYQPFAIDFGGPVFALFQNGRLTGFEGAASDVAAANAHYDEVSRRYGIDRDFVHSWHAGIHPGCTFTGRASDSYQRWSGSAFGNPRLLHFHTCGAYAPGEICWNVVDPTVTADGVAVWQDGRLCLDRLPGGAELLARYPEIAELFAHPRRDIGL